MIRQTGYITSMMLHMTGAFDNWKTFVPIILAMALFIGVGIYQMKKRKKPVK